MKAIILITLAARHLVFRGLFVMHDRLRNLGIFEVAGMTALCIKGT